MKKPLLLLPLILLITAYQSKPGNSLIRIKEVDNLKTGSSATYIYDEQGRVLTMKSSLGATVQYQYIGNLAIKQFSGAGNFNAQTDTFELDKNGVAQFDRQGAPGGLSGQAKFKYDENGYRVETKQFYNGVVVAKYTNNMAGGNISRYTYTDDKNISKVVLYFYYPDKANTIGDNNLGMTYQGKDSKNLMKESIALDEKGDTASIMFYHYKFDNQGRVTHRVVRQKNGALQDSTGYTYY
jgi:hypothetical protein